MRPKNFSDETREAFLVAHRFKTNAILALIDSLSPRGTVELPDEASFAELYALADDPLDLGRSVFGAPEGCW